MAKITVYKVKDEDTGLYMSRGGGWDKKGKAWESLGKLKLALQSAGYYSTGSYRKEINDEPLPSSSIKIIEIVIEESEGNISLLADLVDRERRYAKLGLEFGDSFKELVTRIEAQGQNHQFQWVLVTNSKWNWMDREESGGKAEALEVIKALKLKQNKDYKMASNSGRDCAIAFASKAHAMQVRLTMKNKVKGIDIKEFVETNLDEAS